METYVVRVYRRDEDRNILAGIVETVETQERRPFKSSEELHTILAGLERPGAKIVWEKK